MKRLKTFWINLFLFTVIICLGIFVYSNSFSGSFHFDDVPSITENFAIRNISNLQNVWNFWPTRFITYLSIAFNYQIGGLKVFGYHVFNLTTHLLSALLLWWLVKITFYTPAIKKDFIASKSQPLAFLAALIFLLHPIQTQPVDYIIQRACLLAALFYIASLCLYAKARISLEEKQKIWTVYYIGSLTAAIISMFSKEMSISLPFMIFLYELYFFKNKVKFNRKYLIPFVALIAVIPLTMLATKTVDIGELRRISENPSGISPGHYLLTQLRVIVTYIRLVFIPISQNLDYDYPVIKSLFQAPVILSLSFLILILFATFKLLKKYKLISFGIFWFFITLLPESSVIPIKDVIFEHRLYLPMAGFSIFFVSGLYYLFRPKRFRLTLTTLSLLLIVYSSITYQRNKVWLDELSLWSDTVRKSPNKARPYNNQGLVYYQKGDLDKALSNYNKAIELDPNFAAAYNDAGLVYRTRKEFDQALYYFSKAIEKDPACGKAYNNRGVTYHNKGELDQALSDYNRAIELDPNLAEASNNIGLVYRSKGDLEQAIYYFTKAIEAGYAYAQAYNNRAVVYHTQGDFDKALSDYNKALEIDPSVVGAYSNRETLYRAMRNNRQ
jgi:tetratricopeptide (TPR) repeat protein